MLSVFWGGWFIVVSGSVDPWSQSSKSHYCSMSFGSLRRIPPTFSKPSEGRQCHLWRKWWREPWILTLGAVLSSVGGEGLLNLLTRPRAWSEGDSGQQFLETQSEKRKLGSRISNSVYCNSPGRCQHGLELHNLITFMPKNINKLFFQLFLLPLKLHSTALQNSLCWSCFPVFCFPQINIIW